MPEVDDTLTIRRADLDSAITSGVLTPKNVDDLIAFVTRGDQSNAAQSEDEQFRLVSGFSDIFVTVGLALFLGALGFLLSVFVIPVAAWLLAEVFTRRKRMALPSIALLLTFSLSVSFIAAALFADGFKYQSSANGIYGGDLAVVALMTGVAVGLHWLRFRVPITVAAGAAALVVLVYGLSQLAFSSITAQNNAYIILLLGLAVFAAAMFFDIQDRARRTRNTDVAFWLHLLAAPLIVHPLLKSFASLDAMTAGQAVAILAVFALLSIVALVVDRRSLLVSSLLYLGYAIAVVFRASTLGGQSAAVAVLLVGAIVLVLSLAWRPLRTKLLQIMPFGITSRVPVANAVYPKAKANS